MKLAIYSDLHGFLPDVVDCDVAVIAGDVCPDGSRESQIAWLDVHFRQWANSFVRSIWVAGNHDHCCLGWNPDIGHYLCDSGTTVDGVTFWGTPRSLPFLDMAFNSPEPDLAKCLEEARADVLLSHGPAYGFGDGQNLGSRALLDAIDRIRPRLVVTGHIHYSRGIYLRDCTTIVNASMGSDRKTPFFGDDMNQPFQTITKIGQWCQANGVDFAIGGSWALLLQGVSLPEPPHDLDLMIGLETLEAFYSDNAWIRQRVGESLGRSIVVEDCYTVDVLPCLSTFQKEVLERSRRIEWGGISVRLVDPLDIMLFKLGHEFWDRRGAASCKAIVDWKFAQKPNKPDESLNLAGGDLGKHWNGPVKVYSDESRESRIIKLGLPR